MHSKMNIFNTAENESRSVLSSFETLWTIQSMEFSRPE